MQILEVWIKARLERMSMLLHHRGAKRQLSDTRQYAESIVLLKTTKFRYRANYDEKLKNRVWEGELNRDFMHYKFNILRKLMVCSSLSLDHPRDYPGNGKQGTSARSSAAFQPFTCLRHMCVFGQEIYELFAKANIYEFSRTI